MSLSPPIADAIARESEKSPSPTSNMVCWLEYGPILRESPNSFRFLYISLLQTSLAASGDKESTDGDPLVQGAELPGAARSPGSASACVCRVRACCIPKHVNY